MYNTGFNWPFAPQVHFDRNKFKNSSTNVGYWRYRKADGSWADLAVSNSSGWLDPARDFYLPSGHAIAVYEDTAYSWGTALYCKELDYGFYAKDMTQYGTMFIASVWTFSTAIPVNGLVNKTCHILYGSESVISSVLTNL